MVLSNAHLCALNLVKQSKTSMQEFKAQAFCKIGPGCASGCFGTANASMGTMLEPAPLADACLRVEERKGLWKRVGGHRPSLEPGDSAASARSVSSDRCREVLGLERRWFDLRRLDEFRDDDQNRE